MKFHELKNLWKALEDLGVDCGWHPRAGAEVPDQWLERCKIADEQIGRMSDEERAQFVMGERTDESDCAFPSTLADHLTKDNPEASAVLDAAFDDGPLTFVQSVHTTAVEHVAYENSVMRNR